MSTTPQFTTTLSLTEMEVPIRRIVKEAVHDESVRVMAHSPSSIAADWAHEGPDDQDGDRLLLAEAWAAREHCRAHPQEAMDWETFKAELREAEAAGELTD